MAGGGGKCSAHTSPPRRFSLPGLPRSLALSRAVRPPPQVWLAQPLDPPVSSSVPTTPDHHGRPPQSTPRRVFWLFPAATPPPSPAPIVVCCGLVLLDDILPFPALPTDPPAIAFLLFAPFSSAWLCPDSPSQRVRGLRQRDCHPHSLRAGAAVRLTTFAFDHPSRRMPLACHLC